MWEASAQASRDMAAGGSALRYLLLGGDANAWYVPSLRPGRLLPGRIASQPGIPVCGDCAGIPTSFRCKDCSKEGEFYRRGQCARCALADKGLTGSSSSGRQSTRQRCSDSARPFCERRSPSIHVYLVNPSVRSLLARLSAGDVALSHQRWTGSPAATQSNTCALSSKARGYSPTGTITWPSLTAGSTLSLLRSMTRAFRELSRVERFGRWHHLRRIRERSEEGQGSRNATHAAKIEVTEALKFVAWLRDTAGVALAECTQAHVDTYVADRDRARDERSAVSSGGRHDRGSAPSWRLLVGATGTARSRRSNVFSGFANAS